MKRIARLSCVAACAAMLGGCQSFPLTSWMFKGDRADRSEQRQLAANSGGALEEGRAALQEGNLSAAVASFRVAQLDRATRADASNGLGVAYAKLGRPDLAERYFQAAITADPENTRFVANLLRLQQQSLAARRANADAALAAAQPVPAVRESAEMLAGNVERISRGEVRIVTRADLGNAPTMAVAYAAGAAGPADEGAASAPALPEGRDGASIE